MHPYIRAVYTARTYGPYIRVVCTGLYITLNFTILSLLSTAVVRSSSGGVAALRYVLLVLWLTSCLYTCNGLHGASCVLQSGKTVATEITASIPTKFCLTMMISKYTSWVAQQRRRLLSIIALFCNVHTCSYIPFTTSIIKARTVLKSHIIYQQCVIKLRNHAVN